MDEGTRSRRLRLPVCTAPRSPQAGRGRLQPSGSCWPQARWCSSSGCQAGGWTAKSCTRGTLRWQQACLDVARQQRHQSVVKTGR
eukprot:355247-Chlamydomonas_euryale.AAC.1